METQRHWSDKAIARTTTLLDRFSWVTLLADSRHCTTRVPVQTVWYIKVRPPFADALSWVRHELWQPSATFHTSSRIPEVVSNPTTCDGPSAGYSLLRSLNVQSRAECDIRLVSA